MGESVDESVGDWIEYRILNYCRPVDREEIAI